MEVKIRAVNNQDFETIAEIFDHPDVVAQSSQHPYLGIDRVTNLFQGRSESLVFLVIELDEKVQGYIEINLNTKPRAKHVANIGMAVHPDCHGKGLGSQLLNEAIDLADNWLNIVRLELEVYTDNERGVHLYKKFGFEIEGESKYASFKDGEYKSLYRMSRIHPKFNKALQRTSR